jgi:hypothetical protein
MKDCLEKNPGITIVLEYMPSAIRDLGFSPADLIGFLVDRGFQIHVVRPKGKLSTGIPSEVEDSGYVDLLFTRHPIACGVEA